MSQQFLAARFPVLLKLMIAMLARMSIGQTASEIHAFLGD